VATTGSAAPGRRVVGGPPGDPVVGPAGGAVARVVVRRGRVVPEGPEGPEGPDDAGGPGSVRGGPDGAGGAVGSVMGEPVTVGVPAPRKKMPG
jgi:hypothetical protein